ncbi:MAG: hypothetical protein R3A47_02305 [Polyangiales bacterium]
MSSVSASMAMFLTMVVSASGFAQSIDSERFRPAQDPNGFVTIDSTQMPANKQWRLGFWSQYAYRPVRLYVPNRVNVIDHRLAMDAQLSIGIKGRAAIGLDLPFAAYQASDAGMNDAGSAMGDPRITTRVRVFGPNTKTKDETVDGPGVAVLMAVPIPIGTEDKLYSERQFAFDLKALADFHLLGSGAGVMLGWRFRGHERALGNTSLQQELLYGFGIKAPIPVKANFSGVLELRGSTGFNGKRTNTLETDAGIAYSVKGMTVTAIIGAGIVRGFGVPAVRAALGLSWSAPTKDSDHDGIEDSVDQCPRLPEDFDGFQDEDGCMDPDNDNDLIPDEDDKCPNEEALEGRDADEDGCTDPE